MGQEQPRPKACALIDWRLRECASTNHRVETGYSRVGVLSFICYPATCGPKGHEYGWGRLNTVRWRNSFLLRNQPSNCVSSRESRCKARLLGASAPEYHHKTAATHHLKPNYAHKETTVYTLWMPMRRGSSMARKHLHSECTKGIGR